MQVFNAGDSGGCKRESTESMAPGSMNTGAPLPYFIKQVCLDGHQVNTVVDANNKPLLFPSGKAIN